MKCGIGKACFFVIALLCVQSSFAQDIEYNWPDFINENNSASDDGPMPYFESESLTGCSSISFSVQYNSLDWLTPGNLEYATENPGCISCAGDPLDPIAGGCEDCWDFFIFELSVGGSVVLNDFVGYEEADLKFDHLYTWESDCLDPNDVFNVEFDATSQTWTDGEFINLTSFSLICHQPDINVTINPSDEICEGETVNLSVDNGLMNVMWSFGGATVGTGTDITLAGLTTTSSGTYVVEASDINGCASSEEFQITVNDAPVTCPISDIVVCLDVAGMAEIDLSLNDDGINCGLGGDVLWFTDLGDIPASPIADPTTFQSDGSPVYAAVYNGQCYSSGQIVIIDTGAGLSPDIQLTSQTICEGENLDFEVINVPSCGTCTYDWDGPAAVSVGSTGTPQYPFFGATPDFTGDWTVTVTDASGCTGSTMINVVVTEAPTGIINGGGDICPGFCTESGNELTLDLQGGVPPYDVTIEILGVNLNLPAFLPNGEILLCADQGALFPSLTDVDGDGDDDITVPALIPISFSINLIEVIDANGCDGTASGTINYSINSLPNADDPGGPYELCAGMVYDLTTYDDDINGSESILWYEDINLNNDISSPENYAPGSLPTTVYAVADNGTCQSTPVSLDLAEFTQPVLDPIADVTVCDEYEFLIPGGTDLGVNLFYEDSYGDPFFPGDVTTNGDSYSITVGDNPNCTVTETFEVTIFPQPEINSPIAALTGCGEIMLPLIDFNNFDPSNGVLGYFEDDDMGGQSYAELDLIEQTSGLTSIFVYVGNIDCYDEIEIDLIFTSSIEYIIPPYPDEACENYVLPAIGGATPGLAYFTELDGGGFSYFAGDALEDADFYTLYLYDPTIDQTCVDNANEVFEITIISEPEIDAPLNELTGCGEIILPAIDVTDFDPLTGELGYYEQAGQGGQMYSEGDPIDETLNLSSLYVYAGAGDCFDEIEIDLIYTSEIQYILPPYPSEACENYVLPAIGGATPGLAYFTELDGGGFSYFAGDALEDADFYTLYLYDPTIDQTCVDNANEVFEITIISEPEINAPLNELTGCGEIILPAIGVTDFDPLTGVLAYYEQAGQGGQMYSEGDPIDETLNISSLYVYAGAGDCFDEIEIDLIYTSEIQYGLPAYPNEACGELELLAIQGATPEVAYYTEENGGGIRYTAGDFLEAPGTYTLYVYDTSIDQTCVVNANESFTITLEEEPVIDPIGDITVCSTEGYVLPAITGNFLTGDEGYGTVVGVGGTMFEEGETIFETTTIYIFNEQAACPATEIVFTITVTPAPNAGIGDDFQTCIGPTIDLNDLISGADPGGVFVPDGSDITLGGPDFSLWNTSLNDADTPYLFTYMVSDPSGVCDPAMIEFTVELTSDISAGIALPDSTVCQGEIINLFGLIEGESSGGVFLDSNMDMIPDGDWMASESASFNYVIEAEAGCNGDETSINVNVVEAELVTVDIPSLDVCEGSCVDMIVNSNFSTTLDFVIADLANNELYDLNLDVDGVLVVELCADGVVGNFNGNTISLGEEAANFVIGFVEIQNVQGCETDLSNLDDFNIQLINSFEEVILGEVCENEGFMFQGTEYFEDTSFVEFSEAGCDSTTFINIMELPPAENFEDDVYCIGTEVMIGGELYTENTTLNVVLPDASANGCDSTIYIDIAFDNASYNDVFKTICLGDFEELNNVIYDIDFPMGADTLIGGSVLGCDSIITVMLDFYPEAKGLESQRICQGDTVNILGVDFYAGLEQMDVVLENQSSNSCDSIVTVMIDFYAETMGLEQEMICQGDTINILGVDFYAGMEQMNVVLENQSSVGCDSIVEVSIGFLPTMEEDRIFEKCPGDTLVVDGFEITDDNLIGFYALEPIGTDCPAIVNYTTDLLPGSAVEIDTTLCEGESVLINGITFNEDYTYDQMSIPTTGGCDSLITISVNFLPASVSIESELLTINNYQLGYAELGVIDPVWGSNVGSLSCLTCEDPSISIEEDTEVYFSGITEAGCLVADTLFLSIIPEEILIGIYTPNVFNPDDENMNNIYTVYGTEGFMILEMSIYDRWGNLMYTAEDFEPNNELIGWDGRFNGADAEIGVYVGRVVYEELDGTQNIEIFDLTLLR